MSQLPEDCPVCHHDTDLYDVVDFNKSCSEGWGVHLPLTGRPIYYCRCPHCAFIHAPEFRRWTSAEFVSEIYNDRYVEVDPDYVSKRPRDNANVVSSLFSGHRDKIRHLDYGGGNGALSTILSGNGWNSASYDPFPENDAPLATMGRFNLITAFEVFEHVPDVDALMRNLVALADTQCLIIFSTLVTDGHLAPNGRLNWWYASPRNGHISLFSKQSLLLLAEKYGFRFGSFSEGMHCFYNDMPDWAGLVSS